MTLKDMKYKLIVNGVKNLFLEKGINDVTIKDVANELELGEATIYRYFNKKENLVVEVATLLEEEVINQYFIIEDSLNGFESLKKFYKCFLCVFKERVNYYRFINEFDNFILNKDCQVDEYEKKLFFFYQVFMDSYNKGLKDNSVKQVEDVNAFYFTTTHALFGLCKKLASDDVLKQDETINKEKEIKLLIDIIMASLKGTN